MEWVRREIIGRERGNLRRCFYRRNRGEIRGNREIRFGKDLDRVGV